jgi:hypothetical protein
MLAAPASGIAAGTGTLVLKTATGDHAFNIEVMATDQQRALGLMFRRSLPENSGMLFIYDPPQPATMWMKNTLIPLDMLFVDQQGRIIGIHERAVPQSLDTISSPGPSRAVIELNGGTAARLGIRPGDKVVFPTIFGNAS